MVKFHSVETVHASLPLFVVEGLLSLEDSLHLDTAKFALKISMQYKYYIMQWINYGTIKGEGD